MLTSTYKPVECLRCWRSTPQLQAPLLPPSSRRDLFVVEKLRELDIMVYGALVSGALRTYVSSLLTRKDSAGDKL